MKSIAEKRRKRLSAFAGKVLGLFCLVFVLGCFAPGLRAEAAIASGTNGTCSWEIDDGGVLRIWPTDGVSGTLNPNNIYDCSRVLRLTCWISRW